MSVLQFGLTPKTKPLSPKRSALVAALDVGTSKIACLIARLKPQAPQDVLRRRSHAVEVLGFGHTLARGMKARRGGRSGGGRGGDAPGASISPSAPPRCSSSRSWSRCRPASRGSELMSRHRSTSPARPSPSATSPACSPPAASIRCVPGRAVLHSLPIGYSLDERHRHPRSARHAGRAASASTCM